MTNSYSKELLNTDTKKINSNNSNDLFKDAGLNIIDKKIKKKLVYEKL